MRLLDVGCGTGVDVFALSDRVGDSGYVAGIDSSPELIEEARRRTPQGAKVGFEVADAAELPFGSGEFDAVRSERVIMHVADPAKAIAEMLRVTKPGGRVVVSDPDHDMWAPDLADRELTRTLMHWWVDHIRHPWMGRQLPGLLREAGAAEVSTTILPIVLTSLAAADAIIGIGRIAETAIKEGVAPAERVSAWQEELIRRDAEGRFLVCGAIVVASGLTAGEGKLS
jgi:SAM-dependent methyltransferase